MAPSRSSIGTSAVPPATLNLLASCVVFTVQFSGMVNRTIQKLFSVTEMETSRSIPVLVPVMTAAMEVCQNTSSKIADWPLPERDPTASEIVNGVPGVTSKVWTKVRF